MHYDMFFVAVLLVFRHAAIGAPSLQDTSNDKANAIPPVGLLTTSQISSAVKAVVTPQTITPSPIAHANRPSPTHATPEQAIPQGLVSGIPSLSETPQLQPASSFAASTPAPSQTQGLPSQQHLLPEPSSALQGTDLISGQTSISQALPAATATSNSAEAPKIRYALIGVLAGVPALTILGFFITIRWRRSRRVRGLFGNKILPEVPVVGHQKFNSYTKERGGTRISSFFGTSHSGVVRDRDGGFRKVESAPYATSIHSTAGLAGVGAHRGASGNPEPPMIRYINLAEGGPEGEVKKIANFDNPFGTPPPVAAGFVTAPSRVSPHFPQTQSPQLIDLPPAPLHQRLDQYTGPFKNAGLAISHPMAIINPPRGRDQSYEQHHKRKVQEPPAPHRPMRFRQKPPSSPGMLSPDMANIVNMRTRIHNTVHTSHTGSTKPKSNNATTDVRVSVSQSVYGGIASPRIHVPPAKNGSLNPSPVLAYLAPSPKQEYTTPVLPYLASAASSPRNEGAAPVIVIEAASPTIDSESEYADTEAEDEAGALYVNDGYTHARRTGLIGSPHGFVLPSATSSSSSLYSISGYVTTASSSASTIIPLESSTSSAFALSSSSSDDSSVTVKAAMTQEVRMRRPDTDSRRYTACSGSGVSVSWIPRDFDELEKEGLRGIAF